MPASASALPAGPAWESAGRRRQRRFLWSAMLWALVFPPHTHQTRPTLAGIFLVGLALGIGTAAYNTGSNILFIALSLLLSCLILSGVLAWLNFHGVWWHLSVPGPLRAGEDTLLGLELSNHKGLLPTYALWFDLQAGGPDDPARRVHLRKRLPPGGRLLVETAFRPSRRGRIGIGVTGVGSLHPFGFLRKSAAAGEPHETLVWPARIEYRQAAAGAGPRQPHGESARLPGTGTDLIALRAYRVGDSHRMIHWKASARARRLIVRLHAAETRPGFRLLLDPDARQWPRPEQFERLCSLAASLAEDLFQQGRLRSLSIGGENPVAVRRLADLHHFLDSLAVLQPAAAPSAAPAADASLATITFVPDGHHGVRACIDGSTFATV